MICLWQCLLDGMFSPKQGLNIYHVHPLIQMDGLRGGWLAYWMDGWMNESGMVKLWKEGKVVASVRKGWGWGGEKVRVKDEQNGIRATVHLLWHSMSSHSVSISAFPLPWQQSYSQKHTVHTHTVIHHSHNHDKRHTHAQSHTAYLCESTYKYTNKHTNTGSLLIQLSACRMRGTFGNHTKTIIT